MSRLENKIALITGSAGGIGKSIAVRFLQEGAIVIISDLNDEKSEEAAKELGEKAFHIHLDVSKEEEWMSVMKFIKEKFGRLDILVNNAGIIGFERDWGPQDPENTSLESWKFIHSVNSDSVFLGCKHAIKLMKETGGGNIVNMSSRSGIVGVPDTAAYASSKASVRNHTKSVALYCAKNKYNIRCNSLHPASIMTHMWEMMLGDGEKREENLKKKCEAIPMGCMGTPEDVANGALFLVSDEARFITGTELVIDGGTLAGTLSSPHKVE